VVNRCQDWIKERGAGRSLSTIPTPILTRLWYAGTHSRELSQVITHASGLAWTLISRRAWQWCRRPTYIARYRHIPTLENSLFKIWGIYQMITIEFRGESDMRENSGNEVVANGEQLATASCRAMGNKKPTLKKDISTFGATCQYLLLTSTHNWKCRRKTGTILPTLCQCLFSLVGMRL
jgi:hypothetical protein